MQKIIEENHTEAYLTPKALAQRWKMTLHTLEQWRWKGKGPQFFKAGSCIRYPRQEIERFEKNLIFTPDVDVTDKRFLCIKLDFLFQQNTKKRKSKPDS